MIFLAATKQLYEWFSPSVRPSACLSVRPSVLLSVTPLSLCSHHRIIIKFSGVITIDRSDLHANDQGQRSSSQRSETNFATNWAFPDHNYSLNLQMATKLCTKLEIAKKRRHVVFEGHPPNFKVTQYKKPPLLSQMGRFRTVPQVWIHQRLRYVAQSLKTHWSGVLLFSRPSATFQGNTGQKMPILTRIGLFRTAIPFPIYWWQRNDTQSLK